MIEAEGRPKVQSAALDVKTTIAIEQALMALPRNHGAEAQVPQVLFAHRWWPACHGDSMRKQSRRCRSITHRLDVCWFPQLRFGIFVAWRCPPVSAELSLRPVFPHAWAVTKRFCPGLPWPKERRLPTLFLEPPSICVCP